jgi:hypothetical protein
VFSWPTASSNAKPGHHASPVTKVPGLRTSSRPAGSSREAQSFLAGAGQIALGVGGGGYDDGGYDSGGGW